MSEQVLNAIFKRRSIRKYTDQPVERDDIYKILEAGRWAPSGLNNQPFRFLVVDRADSRKQALEECTKYAHTIRVSDTLIAVYLDKQVMYNALKDYQGAGACIQNMLLAAHGLSLGAVWLGEILNQESKVAQILSVDEHKYELMAVLAIGHPAQQGSSSRKPLSEIMLEQW